MIDLSECKQFSDRFCYIASLILIARITEMREQIGQMNEKNACLLAENTKMNTRITEMRKQTDQMRIQMACLD
jgi:regulator of replication initiation timing